MKEIRSERVQIDPMTGLKLLGVVGDLNRLGDGHKKMKKEKRLDYVGLDGSDSLASALNEMGNDNENEDDDDGHGGDEDNEEGFEFDVDLFFLTRTCFFKLFTWSSGLLLLVNLYRSPPLSLSNKNARRYVFN